MKWNRIRNFRMEIGNNCIDTKYTLFVWFYLNKKKETGKKANNFNVIVCADVDRKKRVVNSEFKCRKKCDYASSIFFFFISWEICWFNYFRGNNSNNIQVFFCNKQLETFSVHNKKELKIIQCIFIIIIIYRCYWFVEKIRDDCLRRKLFNWSAV